MSALEFVVFDAEGNEIDWIDPYASHEDVTGKVRVYRVRNDRYSHFVVVPEGSRYEIREIDS